MESNRPPSITKKLLDIFRVVYYMLRKGISKQKLMMDLHLLLKRGKIAGKALGNLMTFHHHHHHARPTHSFSCRSMDPNLSFYNPREVEFSCSNTPWIHHVGSGRRKHRKNNYSNCDYEAVAAIAKAFEMLNNHEISDVESVLPSPSPAPVLGGFGKSPMVVRQLRITDSPFPIKEDEVADGKVDKEAEEFIRRFYEQLRVQQTVAAVATPEYNFRQG